MKKSVLICFFLLMTFFTHSQVKLDSLWGIWNDESASDTSRAKALNAISWDGYLFSQPDSALYFAQLMHDFANKKGLSKEMALAKRTQGAAYCIKSDYSKALEYYQQSFTISKEISDKSGMAATLNNIGVIYRRKGYYPKALDYYQRSLKINEEISDKNGMADVLNNIGIIYQSKGDYSKAMEYYQRSFNLQEELSDLSGMADALNNIGLIYKHLGDYVKAMDYFQRYLKIVENVPDKVGTANALNNIGEVYMNQGEYSQAMDYYQQSLKIKEKISDSKGMVITLNSLGRVYYMQNDYKKAIYWCEKGLYTSTEINAIEEQRDACECLYDAYKALGNDKKTLEYLERITILNDSLQVGVTIKLLQQMEFAKQMLADSLRQEEEKIKVQMAHESEVRKKNRTRNIYIIAALLLLIFAIGFHRRMVFVRRAKKMIEKEKGRSDKLLLNILPSEIAEELKEKGQANARKFEMVTVLFSDFKGFTQISEKLSAEELVSEINNCFKPFDNTCVKYGIEKIKTIGDSYMAAGGLPVPSNDSVKNTVLAGLEMAEFISNRKQDRESKGDFSFEIRIGIHTGPVVAGIVGVTKFQYDIWGDAVNTASRMESSGEVGKVNISEATYKLLKEDDSFSFTSRGKIEAKGKGEIEMYFVSKN